MNKWRWNTAPSATQSAGRKMAWSTSGVSWPAGRGWKSFIRLRPHDLGRDGPLPSTTSPSRRLLPSQGRNLSLSHTHLCQSMPMGEERPRPIPRIRIRIRPPGHGPMPKLKNGLRRWMTPWPRQEGREGHQFPRTYSLSPR